MERLRRLGKQWSLGFAALLLLGVSAFAFALLTILVAVGVGLVSAFLPVSILPAMPGLGLLGFLELTAFVWLPLSVGVVLPSIAYHFASHIREIEESKRKAELAPYMRKPAA